MRVLVLFPTIQTWVTLVHVIYALQWPTNYHNSAGTHFACKTIPKIPKRGKGTPRYLLKLQTEVDAMVQLGPSLDAVYLKVCIFWNSILCTFGCVLPMPSWQR